MKSLVRKIANSRPGVDIRNFFGLKPVPFFINNSIKNDQDDFLFQDNTFNIKETYLKQIKYFIHCLKNNETPMNSLPEAIDILKICLQND